MGPLRFSKGDLYKNFTAENVPFQKGDLFDWKGLSPFLKPIIKTFKLLKVYFSAVPVLQNYK